MSGRSLASHVLIALALILAAAFPGRAWAATTCEASLSAISFGTITPGLDAEVTATLSYECTTEIPLFAASQAQVRMCIGIGPGSAPGSTVSSRRMASGTPGGTPLAFQLYRDSQRTLPWGDSASGAITWQPVELDYRIQSVIGIGGSGQGSGTVSIHGVVPAQSLLTPGSYHAAFADARVTYRYSESWLIPEPRSCQSGGTGGGSSWFGFNATAHVPSQCTVQAGNLDFGNVPGLITQPHDQTSVIELDCTPGTVYQVGLDQGQHAAAGMRRMRHAAAPANVAYILYRDPGRTRPWGATLDVDTVSGTGTGIPQQLTVHGRIPAGQVAPAGSYRDVVTVTVSY